MLNHKPAGKTLPPLWNYLSYGMWLLLGKSNSNCHHDMQEHAGRQCHELHVFVNPHTLTPAIRACMHTTPKMAQSAQKLGAGSLLVGGLQKAISHT